MKFFNRYLLIYAGIVLSSTLLLYYTIQQLNDGQQWPGILVMLMYVAVIGISAVLMSRRDPYQGFFGFNYHSITYVICLAVPLLFHSSGQLADIQFVSSMAITWGIGIIVHLIIVLILFRKRRMGSYDKKDIFQ